MTTKVYFVRHAQSALSVKDPSSRPLAAKGFSDTKLVTSYLSDKGVTAVYSSQYIRAYDTVRPFSESVNLPITIHKDFRERDIGKWIDDFKAFSYS